MLFKNCGRRVLAALGALTCMGLAMHAQAQCVGYSVAPGPGVFVPGTDDIGNHCDDCVTSITLPFNFNFYGTSYGAATASSNGTLQFTTAVPAYINNCLPSATFAGPTIFPFWDDNYTSGTAAGQGIFTSLTGTSPNQVFVIEWRTQFCCTTAAFINDYEIKFYEGQDRFDIIYGTPMSDRCSATIGCQDGAGTFTQFGCNTAGGTGCTGAPTAGLSLRFSCVTANTAGACCNPAAGTCNIASSATCTGAGNFQGVGTSCPANCPQPGACCNTTTGVCTQTGLTGCTSPSTFSGVGSACAPNPCVGACCNTTTGACTQTTASGCVSPSQFQSLGLACTPSNPCPQPPAPSNDICSDVVTANAPRVPGAGGVVTGTNAAALTDGNASCTAGFRDVYFLFTPTVGGDWQFDTCATTPSFDTMISIHSACPADTSTQIACNDDSCGLLSRVNALGLTAGVQVIVRVGSFSNANLGGPFTLTVGQIEVGACCNAASGVCTSTSVGSAGCAAGTTYQGQGTSCTPNICPQPPTGACCNSTSGACTQVFSFNCSTATSTYSGDNTTCDGSGFCTAAGTCCTSLGNCVVRFVATCPSGLTANSATSCTAGLCPVTGNAICENFDTGTVGSLPANWTASGTGAGTPWAIDSTQSNSAPNAVFTNDVATVGTQTLELPAVTAGGSSLTLDFLSYFSTENTFDGWVVEFSTDAGATWTDIAVGGAWVLNGYNTAAISANFGSPIAGRPAFSGISTAWTNRIASIPTTAGQSVRVRFLMATDTSIASIGVWLDNICIGGIQGTAGNNICCRGSTCTTTIATAAACTSSLVGGQTAGATFLSAASCNAAVLSNTPCCYADYNKLNGITVTDIFNFLTDWFAGSPYARVGSNGGPGVLSVQNIFDFLGNWFAGGC